MRRKVAAALVAALALTLVGCGSGERTKVVGKAVAVRRLEAACMAGQRAGRARLHKAPNRTTFVYAMHENLRTIVDRLAHVETTGSAEADFDAFKASVQTRLAVFDRITAADQSDWPSIIASKRRTVEQATRRQQAAMAALGARHVCV